MRVLTFVNYLTGALVLQDLVDAGHDVVGVVCFPENPSQVLPSPEYSVREVAYRNFLPVYTVRPDQINTAPFVAVARKLRPDLIVSMHFAKILGKRILATPRLGCVNMHPSLLPAGRGMTPFVWHMALGESHVYQALHYLDAGIDTGDVIDVASVEVTAEDTGFTITRKLCYESAALLKRCLPLIEAGTAPRRPQGEVGASYCKPGDPWNRIVWSRSSVAVDRQIRAFARPMSGSVTCLGGQHITVWSARLASAAEQARALSAGTEPGAVVAVLPDGWLIQTGDSGIVITDATTNPDAAPGAGVTISGLPAGPSRLG